MYNCRHLIANLGYCNEWILANCPVFGGTSRFFHSSIKLIFSSVPLLHEISPLCPAFFYSCIILFYCVSPCPEKFNAASRFYHGSGWHVCECDFLSWVTNFILTFRTLPKSLFESLGKDRSVLFDDETEPRYFDLFLNSVL